MECFILYENIVSNSMLVNIQERISQNEFESDIKEEISCTNNKNDQLLLDPDVVYHMLRLDVDFD